jgi:hypothetical protein
MHIQVEIYKSNSVKNKHLVLSLPEIATQIHHLEIHLQFVLRCFINNNKLWGVGV